MMNVVEAAIDLLTAAGFVDDGQTREETVRVPTQRSPVHGTTGGEQRTFGGRHRLALPGTDIRATVGPRTVNIYRSRGGTIVFLAQVRTQDINDLQLEIERIGSDHATSPRT